MEVYSFYAVGPEGNLSGKCEAENAIQASNRAMDVLIALGWKKAVKLTTTLWNS